MFKEANVLEREREREPAWSINSREGKGSEGMAVLWQTGEGQKTKKDKRGWRDYCCRGDGACCGSYNICQLLTASAIFLRQYTL
jgi:hypothetical protein